MILLTHLIAFVSGLIAYAFWQRMTYIRIDRNDNGEVWIRRRIYH